MKDYKGLAAKVRAEGLDAVLDVEISTKKLQAKLEISRDVATVVKTLLQADLDASTVEVKPK